MIDAAYSLSFRKRVCVAGAFWYTRKSFKGSSVDYRSLHHFTPFWFWNRRRHWLSCWEEVWFAYLQEQLKAVENFRECTRLLSDPDYKKAAFAPIEERSDNKVLEKALTLAKTSDEARYVRDRIANKSSSLYHDAVAKMTALLTKELNKTEAGP